MLGNTRFPVLSFSCEISSQGVAMEFQEVSHLSVQTVCTMKVSCDLVKIQSTTVVGLAAGALCSKNQLCSYVQ